MGQTAPAATLLEIAWGGKLPGHGDFVWSAPRTALRAQLEQWLHLGMLQGRSRYGEGWNRCLDQGSAWNFLLPARYSGDAAILAGCVAPSRDRVGRRYPLAVACALPATTPPETGKLSALPGLLAQLRHALHTGIGRSWPRDALGGTLEAVVSAWQAESASDVDRMEIPGQRAEAEELPALCPWPDIARLLQKSHCPSLWWTSAAAGAPLKTLAYEPGLDPALLVALFGPQAGIRPQRGQHARA